MAAISLEGLSFRYPGASTDTLSALCGSSGGRYQCYAGYAGWGPGQLERELRHRHTIGELVPEDILAFLRDGEISKVEAGIALQGWEVKALRAGKGQITESYVLFKNNEAWLLGAQIAPLPTASTHVRPDPTRTRKLLLHRGELSQLIGAVERKVRHRPRRFAAVGMGQPRDRHRRRHATPRPGRHLRLGHRPSCRRPWSGRPAAARRGPCCC